MNKLVGKYLLGKELGSGAFATVFQCTDTETDIKYAMKIVEKQKIHKERIEHQIKREVKFTKSLQHENIVGFVEAMQTTDHVYLVLELVSGGELLDKIITQKRFDEDTARKYFRQLICGVQYCHEHGVAHRDLKPENLLLDRNGTLKISDFGCSNLQPMDTETLLKTRCGTVQYMAPEVLQKGEGYNGFLADAWSCGVILYVMLTGYLPFDDDDARELCRQISVGNFRMSSKFSPGAKDLISKLLTTDPKRRLPVAEVLQHPWMMEACAPVTNLVVDASSPIGHQPAQTASPSSCGATFDVFHVISQITQGSLNPYTKHQPGLEDRATREKRSYMLVAGLQSPLGEVDAALKHCGCNTKVENNEIKGFACGKNPADVLTLKISVVNVVAGFTLIELHCAFGNGLHFREVVKALAAQFGSKCRSHESI